MLITTFPTRSVGPRLGRRVERSFAPFADFAFASRSLDRSGVPTVSATWKDDTYVLTLDVPGVPEEALSVSVAGRTLMLDVTTEELSWNERIRLPHTLDVASTTANYANGRLTVTVPTAPEAQSRKVEITVGAPAPAQLAPAEEAVGQAEADQSASGINDSE